MKRKRMGELLVEGKLIKRKQLSEALKINKKTGQRIGQILIEMGWTTEVDICRTLSKQANIPMVSLKNKKIDQKIFSLVPAKVCHKKRVVPIGLRDNKLWVAMNNPTDYGTVDDISFITGYPVKVAVALEKEIMDQILRYHSPIDDDDGIEMGNGEYAADAVQVVEDIQDSNDINFEKLEKAAKGGVIKQLTNGIILSAIRHRASDIHIEPQEEDVVVRYRIDGIMRDVMNFAKVAQAAAISRIKIMSNLDITIRRKPQDGRSRVRVGESVYDLRVSSLPTFYGEKIVMRILDPQKTTPLSQLGLPEKELNLFHDMLATPQGLVLVTGPTGSGKTTTLYAALNHLHSPKINIVTIEDPIEYSISGINQVQVNPATGLTFAKGLRSLLRQDPNVVMIGEIRDRETATIALQAAQTGHLVLSTLHTNDAAAAIVRLVDIGVEPYAISSTLLGIMAQRLVRRVHQACSKMIDVDAAICSRFPATAQTQFPEGEGCLGCQKTGFKGRVGIYELLMVNQEISGLITKGAADREILIAARRTGMLSMTEDGFEKAKKGITTLEEVLRTAPPSETSPIGPLPEMKDPERGKKAPAMPRREKAPAGIEPAESGIRRDRILVVDDDETIREYLKAVLEYEYYEVMLAVDGKDALDTIFEQPPDLVIIDYAMPVMNGLELIEKLKSHSQLSALPTIMLTATETEESEIQALTIGADDWIQKPIHKQRLLVRIKRLLKTARR